MHNDIARLRKLGFVVETGQVVLGRSPHLRRSGVSVFYGEQHIVDADNLADLHGLLPGIIEMLYGLQNGPF